MSGKKYDGPGNPTHGLASTYRNQAYRCRCQPCREANTALQKKEDASRRERLAADPTLVEHGKVSTYVNWGCRCDECTRVHSAECAARAVRRAQRAREEAS